MSLWWVSHYFLGYTSLKLLDPGILELGRLTALVGNNSIDVVV